MRSRSRCGISKRQGDKERGDERERSGGSLHNHVHVPDRAALAEATELIAHYGEHAQMEAAQRASRSRTLGNVIHFCRWRQIERAIEMLSDDEVTGSIN